MKELYNRDPAPGSYSVSTAETSMLSTTAAIQNSRGYGNGFVSKNNRFTQLPIERERDPSILIGPGTYSPQKPERNIQVPKFDPKNGFNLPFNEKNPLNYVKAITVNIYFKQNNPGVGTYDPLLPVKNTPNCASIFNSKVKR